MHTSGQRRASARLAWHRIHSLPLRPSIGRASGLASKATMTRLVAAEALLGERHQPPAGRAVPVRVTGLGGRTVWLRPRSRDRAALEFLYLGHHLPPGGLAGPVRHVAVFGANIGLLVADLAARYPQARLLGVEPDPDNAELARRNVAHLGDRATLTEAAVWYRDETLALSWQPDAWGQAVSRPAARNGHASRDAPDGRDGPASRDAPDGRDGPASRDGLVPGPGVRTVSAVGAGRLLAAFTGPAPLDYLLVNIESAWHEMLRHGQWTANVRSIRIEIQDHYDDAVPLLEGLGYQAHLERLRWGAYATGVRPG